MAENPGSVKTKPKRISYTCNGCGEITTRKETELAPERCPLCRAPMFIRPIAEEM